jgi:hypothetical protein
MPFVVVGKCWADAGSGLRARLGRAFKAGVVLYTGPEALEFSDRRFAAPVSHRWRRRPRSESRPRPGGAVGA